MSDKLKFSDSEQLILSKALKYCSSSEQCCSALQEKLRSWGADNSLIQRITDHLIEEGYLDDARYARIYAESKLHLQKWGRTKIAYNLRMKRIDNQHIQQALQELDPMLYHNTLEQLAESKFRSIHDDDPTKRMAKLISFLTSHGFTYSEIQMVTKELR